MTTIRRTTIALTTVLVVSMMAMPALATTGIPMETEELSVLLLMAGLYVAMYALAIGSVTGLVYLLFKGAGSICNLLAYLVPAAATRRITKPAS